MKSELYVDAFIIDNYEEPKIQIERETPREIQAELRSFF